MRTKYNTILITGGATGIGFALAEAFVKAGNKVLICGRREAKLKEARGKLPQIQTIPCDLLKKEDRESFCDWVIDNHEDLNILVNNAGIQRAIDLRKGTAELFDGEDEVQSTLLLRSTYRRISLHCCRRRKKQPSSTFPRAWVSFR